MQRTSFSLILSAFIMIAAASAFAAPRPSAKKSPATPANCNVVGIKSIDQYVVKSNRTCFKNAKQAEAKGFTAFSTDSETAVRGFTASATSAQEVPVNSSTATGSCLAVLNAAQTGLSVKCTHNVTSPILAHIHIGVVGVSGGIACDLGDPTNPIEADCTVDSTLLQALLAGETYVNIHSTQFSGGEIRGQLN